MQWNRNQIHLNFRVIICLLVCAAFIAFYTGIGGASSVACVAPQKVSAQTLVLDAGHGGEDGGAVSVTGAAESGINLRITLKLKQLCGFFGINTVLTREDDHSMKDSSAKSLAEMKRTDLTNRVKLIEAQENAVLISIHQNFFFGAKSSGAQVFYAPTTQSNLLAERCQQLLVEQVDPSNHRQAKKISADIYLMNHVSCPAILVECGFLSNREEAEKLQTDPYQTQLATAILAAYLTYRK